MAFLETDTLGQERFSLLLLEPGEIYFEDYSVYYYPAGLPQDQAIKRKQQGHLKLCSKSVVFVPKEIQFPLLKFPLKHVQVIDEWSGGLFSKLGKVIQIVTNQTVEMKEKNIVAPFVFKKEKSQHIFSLNYASVDDCLPHMCQLHRASTLFPGDQDAMLNAIMLSRQARVKFNTSWLDDIYEKIVLEVRGDRVTPLATNPGRVMLTSSRLYFQPLNNIDKWPVLKLRLKDIKRLICRRFLLRQLGLEIYCGDGAPVSHLYLAFKTEELRNELYEQILNLPDINLEDTGQADMTLRWQSGTISNYDYLLYLNSLADRSFNDLTQYPVMPWIIQNYTSENLDLDDESNYRDLSKPIGALNNKRLETIKERMVDLPPGPKFMYGSHYSTPGYVLFYLARIAPEYVLCLQNGKFDHPDRMFNDLSMTWNNCLTGASDFKELIPEFYSGSGDFLTHRGIINFGFRMDSRPIGDVHLPPWASSASEFITKLSEALESDIVSRSLHRWIDLVFGFQQRGEEAVMADNLFYYLTYEGAIDLNSIIDETERHCLETQIQEFGQTPKQLFTSPHPQRFTTQSIPKLLSPICIPEQIQTGCINEITSGGLSKIDTAKDESIEGGLSVSSGSVQTLDIDKIKPYLQYTLHKDSVTEVCMSPDGLSTFSVSQDSFLKMYSLEDQRQLRSVNMSLMALSSCEVINDKTIVVGCWDNKVYFYSIEYGRVLDTLNGHDDAVSCVKWKAGKLYTASWDSTVKVWAMDMSSTSSSFPMPECMAQLDHDEGVTCMDIDSDSVVMVTGAKDGHLVLWDLTCYYTLSSLLVHSGPVTACLLSLDKRRIFTCGEDGLLKGIDTGTMTEILIKDLEHPISCMSVTGTSSLLLSGDKGGRLCVWDMDKGQVIQTRQAHQGSVTCMDASHSGALLTGGGDKTVILWKPLL